MERSPGDRSTVLIEPSELSLCSVHALAHDQHGSGGGAPRGQAGRCASPARLEKHGTPVRPDDLPAHAVPAYSLFLAGDNLKSGALVQLLPEYLSIALGVYVVYPTRTHLSPKVRLLIDHLIKSARQRGWPP